MNEDTPPLPPALLAAYLNACYWVHSPAGEVLLRVGHLAPQLEAHSPAARYTLITAFNPGSLPRSMEANQLAHDALHARLASLTVPVMMARSHAPDGTWPEPGWLAMDLETALADILAKEFGQAGILHWAASQPVGLRIYRPPGMCADTVQCVDWIG